MPRIFTATESGLALSHKHIGRDQRRNRKPATTTGSCGLWSAGEMFRNHHVSRTYRDTHMARVHLNSYFYHTEHRKSSRVKHQTEIFYSKWGFIINALKMLIIFTILVYWLFFYGCCRTSSYREMACFITWTYRKLQRRNNHNMIINNHKTRNIKTTGSHK